MPLDFRAPTPNFEEKEEEEEGEEGEMALRVLDKVGLVLGETETAPLPLRVRGMGLETFPAPALLGLRDREGLRELLETVLPLRADRGLLPLLREELEEEEAFLAETGLDSGDLLAVARPLVGVVGLLPRKEEEGESVGLEIEFLPFSTSPAPVVVVVLCLPLLKAFCGLLDFLLLSTLACPEDFLFRPPMPILLLLLLALLLPVLPPPGDAFLPLPPSGEVRLDCLLSGPAAAAVEVEEKEEEEEERFAAESETVEPRACKFPPEKSPLGPTMVTSEPPTKLPPPSASPPPPPTPLLSAPSVSVGALAGSGSSSPSSTR